MEYLREFSEIIKEIEEMTWFFKYVKSNMLLLKISIDELFINIDIIEILMKREAEIEASSIERDCESVDKSIVIWESNYYLL